MADDPRIRFSHGHIHLGEGADRVTFPDPSSKEFSDTEYALRYGTPSRGQLLYAASAMSAYTHLLTYPNGTEFTVAQLRALRRALKGAPDGG